MMIEDFHSSITQIIAATGYGHAKITDQDSSLVHQMFVEEIYLVTINTFP